MNTGTGTYTYTYNYIKRHLFIGFIFFMLFVVPLETSFAAVNSTILQKGSTGPAVTILQNKLNQIEYLEHSPTGFFGDMTETAVIKFQKQHHLLPDGIVGEATYSKINSLLNTAKNRPMLIKGMNGPAVNALQRDLKQLGYFSLAPTGYYGTATEDAVIKFQKKYNLVPDGKVGESTYKRIDIILKRIVPIKIVIDPGHGGIDSGASKGNVVESEVTLSISKKLQAYLASDGYDVILTRNKDISLDSLSSNGKTRQERDLNARTTIINNNDVQLFVSIHVDSYPAYPSMTGSIVYYNSKFPKSIELAQNIQRQLNCMKSGSFKRQAHNSEPSNFYVLRNSDVPGVLVETAFISNTKERQLLATDDYRNKIAKAILSGIEMTQFN